MFFQMIFSYEYQIRRLTLEAIILISFCLIQMCPILDDPLSKGKTIFQKSVLEYSFEYKSYILIYVCLFDWATDPRS